AQSNGKDVHLIRLGRGPLTAPAPDTTGSPSECASVRAYLDPREQDSCRLPLDNSLVIKYRRVVAEAMLRHPSQRAAQLLFNPFDVASRVDPYVHYQALRNLDSVHRSPLGFWVLSRYEDVRIAQTD